MFEQLPRLIHQIWLQGTPPVKYLPWCATWQQHHQKGWEYFLWDENSLSSFIDEQYPQYAELWQSMERLGQKADFSRYLLMHHFGGVYADLDAKLCVDLDYFLTAEFERELYPGRRGLDSALQPLGDRLSTDILISAEGWSSEYILYHHGARMRKLNICVLFSMPDLPFWTEFIESAIPDRDLSVLNSFGVNSFTEFVYRHLFDCVTELRRSGGKRSLRPQIGILPPKLCGSPWRNIEPKLIQHFYHGTWKNENHESTE